MEFFKNKVKDKENIPQDVLTITAVSEAEYTDLAEQVENVVISGIEQEDYSGINEHLNNIVTNDGLAETYVFEGVCVGKYFLAISICAILFVPYLYFLFISIGTLVLSGHALYIPYAVWSCGVSLIFIAFNAFLICFFINRIKFNMRIEVYENILKFKRLDFVQDIASFSKQQEQTVIRDLQKAVSYKLIPQGHFSKNDVVFMVSDKLYNSYLEKSAVYDRYFKKQLEERDRMKARTEEISRIIELGNQYIEKIHDSNEIIKDKAVSKKLDKMEAIVSTIFHEIDVNPNQAHSLGMFLYSYLPTTEKLLDAYISIGEKQIVGKNLSKTKKEIEDALETIVKAYEGILEKLYEEHEMDISSDIAAMEIMMKQDGLTSES